MYVLINSAWTMTTSLDANNIVDVFFCIRTYKFVAEFHEQPEIKKKKKKTNVYVNIIRTHFILIMTKYYTNGDFRILFW